MIKIIKLIPNLITISRILVTFIFADFTLKQFVFGQNNNLFIILSFVYICISDFVDGKIARKTNSDSIIGAKLDVGADIFYIIVSYNTLIGIKILHIWYFVFVCFKFVEFIITSRFIKNNKFGDKPFIFDKIGKSVSSIFILIPGIICIYNYVGQYTTNLILNFIIYTTVIFGLYSSYLRIKTCYRLRLIEVNSK